MRLIKLIVPAALVATLGLFVSQAGAQTMGEYAATTASVGSGASSAGTDLGGSSGTWGASSLGASFDERAGAASSSSSGQDFESRAGSMGASATESRWPTSSFDNGQGADRFSQQTDRFGSDQDRFPQRTDLSSETSDRFPASSFNDNKMGLDTNYSSSSGLDTHFNAANN
jgi:hypothetical protein